MDILEQLEQAHVMVVNDMITYNFGYNADDPEEDWMLSVYCREEFETYEYYWTKDDLRNATPTGDGFFIAAKDIDMSDHIAFYLLVPVDNDLGAL